MALTLDAALAAAQDSQSRKPLVEIMSSQSVADIPFDGTTLNAGTFNQYGANIITHSSGRLCLAYCYGPDADGDCGIKYVYTNVERTEFFTVTIELFTDPQHIMDSVSLCEMTDGTIGMIYTYHVTSTGKTHVWRKVIDEFGAAVSGGEIWNQNTSVFLSDPWVSAMGADSYMMIFGLPSGSDFYLYTRTSTDFVTWSAASALSIGGLTSTFRLSNPSMLKISNGDWWLWFDVLEDTSATGYELTNIYYSVSSDNGATWSNAAKITHYSLFSRRGLHPVAAQKAANQMHVLFTEFCGAMHMEHHDAGWPAGGQDEVRELSWDSVNRKLYCLSTNSGGVLYNIVRIDVDTWLIDKYWDTTTTPAIPAGFTIRQVGANRHDGHHIAVCSLTSVLYFDGEAETVFVYNFAAGGNITGKPVWMGWDTHMEQCQVDISTNKIWLLWDSWSGGEGARWHGIGWIDVTETTGYAYHPLISNDDDEPGGGVPNRSAMYVDNASGVIAFATSFYGACILAYDIATGALIKRWSTFEATELNGYGAMAPVIYDGRIYCGTCDSNNYQGQYIVECDPSNGSINWWQPDYVVPGTNTNMRGLYHMKDGILAFMHYPYDVVLFDTVNHTWTVYNDDNVPGLTENYHILQYITQFAFDAANEMIMFGDTVNYSGRYGGAVMFSINGYINRTYYSVGTFSGGAWSWSTPANMVQGYMDYEGVPALDPAAESALFIFWTHRAVDGLLSIQWDKDGSAVNISKYLIGEIATEQSIGGAFATLSLTVSHGHLFDPYNHSSALSPVLKKGRTLTLRWGEDIGGTEYWQNCGTFYITAASMSFKRGEYPEMSVTAEDRRCEWTHSHVYVTEIYNNLPDYIIKDILTANAGLTAGEINISAFVGGIAIQMQWIETTIDEIINQVCERFGYYFRFDADGKANCRQIRNTAAPDHTYADSTKIIHYTPDDKYSDFTNRITVRGQSLLFTTVTYPEERITSISGTLGWWGCKGTHQIWFSDDKSRRCINPRMEIIESSCSMAMSLAGSIEEYLEECPEAGDDKYCTIHAEAPNLVAQLISCAAGYMAACAIPDGVTVLGFIASGGFTISIGRLLEGVSMFCIVNILGAVANYQYEVWAQPLGEIRQSVQGQWNDEDHQVEINAVVEQVLDDPLCYTINDCQTVANFEGMVVQMQRRRISIEKIAHLQDEDGDTIRFVHPYSVQAMDLFVATLRRKFKKSEPDSNDGYFLDEIEGWVLA